VWLVVVESVHGTPIEHQCEAHPNRVHNIDTRTRPTRDLPAAVVQVVVGAKALGAEVTGVSSARNLDLLRSLGVDHVIDYTEQDFSRGERRYDVILDNVLNHPPSATARVATRTEIFIQTASGTREACSRACRGWRARPWWGFITS
jgi:Zinc-binding dehydrogenase